MVVDEIGCVDEDIHLGNGCIGVELQYIYAVRPGNYHGLLCDCAAGAIARVDPADLNCLVAAQLARLSIAHVLVARQVLISAGAYSSTFAGSTSPLKRDISAITVGGSLAIVVSVYRMAL